jgi:hypothetical protein
MKKLNTEGMEEKREVMEKIEHESTIPIAIGTRGDHGIVVRCLNSLNHLNPLNQQFK